MTSQRKSDSEYADTLGGRLGEDKSTRSQTRLPTQNDEERLLPGNTIRSDPAAVKIVPGSAGQKYGRKSKLNIQAFKPYDTISRRVRESGPVRARGKADQSSSSQRSTRGIVTRPENGAVHDDQERPSKRRRRESQDTFRGVISIPDDDIMEQIPPDNTYLSGHSTRLSPALSQHSDRTKLRDPSSKRNRVDEYRDVERGIKPPRTPKRGSIKYTQLFSDEYYEERFTEDAARERRAMASDVEPESAKLAWPDRAGKHEAIESVEVHSPPSKEQQDGPNLDCPSVATDQNHPDSSRDSPDELQGGATVQPAPMLLKRGREKETSNSMSEPKEHPGARLLHGQHVQLLYRRDDWLENSFMRRSEDLAEKKAKEAKHLGEDKPKSISYRAPEVAKRVKLSDSLQDTYENTAGQIQPSDTASVECSKSATETLGNLIAPSTRELPSNEQVADKGSVKKLFPGSSFSNRATRSMSRRAPATTVVCDDEVEDDGSQLKAEEKDKKWHKPLVYPRFGKKKAEVDAQDRERLRDNEFLNDNLIGFYIRFLEDHLERTNNEVAKRVYFFNSYFFATLTNVKGRRNINYEGVQKWTRAVDIFAFDYIVVPINENAHWYVAIICNLPNLPGIADKNTENRQPSECDKDSSAAPESEGREIPETPEPIEELPAGKPVKANDNRNSEPAKDEATRQSFETMSLSDKEELEDRAPGMPPTEWPEQEENLIFSPAKFSSPAAKVESTEKASVVGTSELAASPNKGSKKKKAKPSGKPGGAKFDIRQATIITFDSLDLSRSPTISNLRDYLYEEAKSKRGIEIDRSLIRGMRARAIPLQSNYSDCGLYLLAYIEKFVQDPDLFVRKLLRREMKTQDDWPLLKSGILRRRLRDFLDDLYDEQALSGSEKASEKGVLADRYPISYLLGSSASTSAQNEECNDSQQQQLKVSSSTEIDAQKHPLRKRRPASNRSSPATSDGNQNLKTERDGTHQIAPSLKNPVVEITVPNVSDKIDDKVVEVQVPNSQEQAQEASSCPSKILEKDKSPSDQAAMKPVDHEVCPVENKETKKPKQPAKLPTVEVQIIPPSYQDSIKNQHSTKQKPK
ncbi:Ulp1 protease family protein [Aspergillus nomiae NRRL 13137]|uniref:Ulp1 protease family protein n=1 Tax=Aspergillus nomiae NRRL (strain ATCC 15546 / NRRL 13137 / CBS 260.88 / M93) TaxID=1509407 RepID=A0A0L1JER4_ASPN3|nr:Ulp1 protease family protein [Aspergillus nomiae NRRL 13137]KNG90226.1 Ulp1 protease family protein [Aspergillus nomiae NRRL 13137]